jgi:hypothetical protein
MVLALGANTLARLAQDSRIVIVAPALRRWQPSGELVEIFRFFRTHLEVSQKILLS